MIERSLRCFVMALFGLIPILGLPFAIGAIAIFHRCSTTSAGDWNPARRYLLFGIWCGILGVFISTTSVWWIFIWLSNLN